jgi:ubiquinone/menaquinone biosynthesis C-methylase UbiE
MGKFGALWEIIVGVGPVMRLSRETDQIFRYYVLETLDKEKLFTFLEQPHTYAEILQEFGYVDNTYTREILNILVKDKHPMLLEEDGKLRRNPALPMPALEDVVKSASKRIQSFGLMAKGMTEYIPLRLRNEPIEFSSSFEQDGRQLLTKFDKTLGNQIYTAVRKSAFALLKPDERKWLKGKTLLEVGCGSGRETAELWLRLGGNIRITAIDTVPSLLELAEQHFSDYLDEIDPAHPPLTDSNRPRFMEINATKMPFENDSFDAAFHSLVLHWTSDPRQVISEIVRVLKPGGLIFGTQATKPQMNPYFDIVIRTNKNSYGFFWQEEFRRWYAEQGVRLEIATPVGTFRGHKPE